MHWVRMGFEKRPIENLVKRVVRIRKDVSKKVQAYRGITVGSGSAVIEMKLVRTCIFLKVMAAFPAVIPSCFVDDLSDEHDWASSSQ